MDMRDGREDRVQKSSKVLKLGDLESGGDIDRKMGSGGIVMDSIFNL
jgi:hypothetical protein